ncbi:glutaredoxin [Cupriavidus basilensis]|uniref:Glutaredoxin n=1 Tax=Cupriavidus basilensis TaxID=68895 RepID=A0ABT6ANF7_9BURK|nr:glutaredoxin [Cupriavidus basilensis]MDF3834154.1 glutaredoxin [Cupriavidus basilensis]
MTIDPGPKRRLTEHQNKMEEAVMASASHPQVIIYTTPTCPDCRTLKAWLAREGIAFEERDLSDPEIMVEAKARTGCVSHRSPWWVRR